jgi:EAL domain-containing protein (putative c-di-GMP-specific phosphodiesterase class I)
VQNAAHDHRDQALIRSTVELGHALDLQVVAEGVEDEPTYTYLAQTGCDVVQGYHISRPLPEAKFTTWLRDHPSPCTTHAADRLTVAR